MGTESTARGPDVARTCVFLISGVALAYWVDLGFTRMDNQISWVRNSCPPSQLLRDKAPYLQVFSACRLASKVRSLSSLVASPSYYLTLLVGTTRVVVSKRVTRPSASFSTHP